MKNAALLVMDYQSDILKIVENKAAALLKNAKSLIEVARKTNTPVIYVKVAFRRGYPELSPNNKSFAALRSSERMLLENPGTDIHPEVAPLKTEVVVIKHRVGAFLGTDLQTILRAHSVENLFLAGISTSGVVLSTLRYAADSDYAIHVISDACADSDEEVHRTLMEKVYPRQANVISTEDALELLQKSNVSC